MTDWISKDDRRTLLDGVRQLREEYNLAQNELARRAEIAPGTLSQILKGESAGRGSTLKKLAQCVRTLIQDASKGRRLREFELGLLEIADRFLGSQGRPTLHNTEAAMNTWQVSKWIRLDAPKVAIIATVGKKVFDPENGINRLEELLNAGASAFRINFSHVSRDAGPRRYSYKEVHGLTQSIRHLEDRARVPIPIIMDLKGPEIRIRKLSDSKLSPEKMRLAKNDTVRIYQLHETEPSQGIDRLTSNDGGPGPGAKVLVVSYEGHFLPEVHERARIRVNDGRIELQVSVKSDTYVTCTVTREGEVEVGKAVNLPDRTFYSVEGIIPKDLEDLSQAFDVDFVAQSFVRKAGDIDALAAAINIDYKKALDRRPFIIAKIETKPAAGTKTFTEIVEHDKTFGVMIARGDLGGELDIADVPAKQLELIEIGNRVGKPVIVATQMLESMVAAPVPTRAEAQDVWSAIREGADAVMLSGETAAGDYPDRAVAEMRRIIERTTLDVKKYRERFCDDYVSGGLHSAPLPRRAVEVVGYPIVLLAEQSESPFIVTYATKGWSATKISRFRPGDPTRTLALTIKPETARILRLLFGVYPVVLKPASELREADLPRDRDAAMELCRESVRQIVANSSRAVVEALGTDWRSRYIVATLAQKKPLHDWDMARILLVFKTES